MNAQSVYARPPGRSTRPISAAASQGRGRCSKTASENTKSNAPSANGSTCASATKSSTPSPYTNASVRTTPGCSVMSRPAPSSSTRSPRSIASRTAGTLSAAASCAGRPPPSARRSTAAGSRSGTSRGTPATRGYSRPQAAQARGSGSGAVQAGQRSGTSWAACENRATPSGIAGPYSAPSVERPMAAVALALLSSVCWGTADFLGGLKSKQVPVLAVLLLSQGPMVAPLVVWALASGEGPTARGVLLGALAGVAGAIALTAFYRGLAIGTMSIVAPISGAGAIVPVLAGVISGERPSGLQTIGIVAALVGVVLASREEDTGEGAADARRAVLLALVAAAGFGAFLALMDPASAPSVPWALVGARVASSTLILVVVLARRVPLAEAAAPRLLRVILLVGLLDVGANALYAAALGEGLLSVV